MGAGPLQIGKGLGKNTTGKGTETTTTVSVVGGVVIILCFTATISVMEGEAIIIGTTATISVAAG